LYSEKFNMDFSNLLIRWYLQNKRDLPWRSTTNPYPIWLSEIILQQTRVAQGTPYFFSFRENFPTVFDLANAPEEQVLKLWQGLGYYSRARNLHQTAKIIAFEKEGVFPNKYTELLKLKGVGEYTAAAIASFSFNEAVPVVDGNVYRVLARVFDIETDISSAKAKKEFQELAFELLPKDQPALFNQAIMEFGALQCTPQSPNCEQCTMNSLCLALQKKKVAQLPIKLKKTKVVDRFLNYIIFEDANNNTLVQQRTEKGIWHKLYEFPLIETSEAVDNEFISDELQKKLLAENEILELIDLHTNDIVHKLSHQKLHIKFWRVMVKSTLSSGISFSEIKKYPFPIVIYNFIEKNLAYI
jgi:A/G-specific adenine glycosylase